MRRESTAMSVSWIPSESVSGPMRRGFEGLGHYDAPPPDVIDGVEELHRLLAEDRFRFANILTAWIDVEDGRIVDAGRAAHSGLAMGSTTVRLARLGATFRGFSLPVLVPDPDGDKDSITFVQTVGGRTGVPLPRPVPHPPFVQWQAPIVWTTMALTLHADGRTEVTMPGASAFPRHWVYGPDGTLTAKSGLTDQATWIAHSFGARTPWGEQDSPALVTAAETALERQMSHELMRGERRPEIRKMSAGATVTQQGEPGVELFLLLDGVLAVEVDGQRLAEVGPGAVLGERALLEGGLRSSTLLALTPARLAVASSDTVDIDHLRALSELHRREEGPPAP